MFLDFNKPVRNAEMTHNDSNAQDVCISVLESIYYSNPMTCQIIIQDPQRHNQILETFVRHLLVIFKLLDLGTLVVSLLEASVHLRVCRSRCSGCGSNLSSGGSDRSVSSGGAGLGLLLLGLNGLWSC